MVGYGWREDKNRSEPELVGVKERNKGRWMWEK
jgi:hypothetical protein